MATAVRVCCVEGCEKQAKARGFCMACYSRHFYYKKKPDKYCGVCGEKLCKRAKSGLCREHRRQTYKGKYSAYFSRWYEENKERHNKLSSAARKANWSKYLEKLKVDRKTKPERFVAAKQRRRTKELGAGGSLYTSDWSLLLGWCGRMCQRCGSSHRLEMDHIFPVSLGGPTSLWNVQPLCRRCNAQKGGKMPAGWANVPG